MRMKHATLFSDLSTLRHLMLYQMYIPPGSDEQDRVFLKNQTGLCKPGRRQRHSSNSINKLSVRAVSLIPSFKKGTRLETTLLHFLLLCNKRNSDLLHPGILCQGFIRQLNLLQRYFV